MPSFIITSTVLRELLNLVASSESESASSTSQLYLAFSCIHLRCLPSSAHRQLAVHFLW
ncbi:hypothetical protein PILCRDRAFT_242460 [Piloderma croceum F 1598]|uniref:Uncharacterized protein n=1 Tax=Piloderma croceum (strain F 1598) TaxID=765440 RepID=A0A0C3BQT6_PILCF|nr:hypothetical protein PILCRDRAFT_242460 [Piloderma croceum F 1598]